MLIVSKSSKLEWDCLNGNLTMEEMLSAYSDDGINTTPITNSHYEQLSVRESVRKTIKSAEFCMMHELSDSKIKDHDIIISCSGDNGLSYISKFLKENQLIAAINSSPSYSSGILTRWSRDNINKILRGDYKIEEWTRLNSSSLPYSPALSELYIGELDRKTMSRHILEYRGESYEQKCSGMIIATGAGSTGWYNSVNWNKPIDENRFNPSDKIAKFAITEPFRFNKGKSLISGEIGYGETISIHSLNSNGIISSDSWDDCEFNKGSETIISLAKPLRVAIPQ